MKIIKNNIATCFWFIHLTRHFSLSHTKPYYVKWSCPIFCCPCGTSMYPHPPHKMIDTPDPPSLPQGVPQFHLHYIKLTFLRQ